MRSSLQNAEDNLKNVQLMRKQGMVSEYDELRATVGVENLRPMVIQSETGYSLSLDNLKNTLGVTPKTLSSSPTASHCSRWTSNSLQSGRFGGRNESRFECVEEAD